MYVLLLLQLRSAIGAASCLHRYLGEAMRAVLGGGGRLFFPGTHLIHALDNHKEREHHDDEADDCIYKCAVFDDDRTLFACLA